MEDQKNNNPIEEILSYIDKLQQEKAESIKASNYDYTDQIAIKIDEMKKSLSTERKKQLVLQHTVEVDALDNAYKQELEDFNSNWDEKFRKLEDKSKSMEDGINIKHDTQMKQLYEYLENKLPKNVKFSRTYLDVKKQEENLVKLQRFKEAASLKRKLEELDKIDTEKFNKDKYEKIKSESVKTANKHMNEKNALRKKIEIEFEVLKKERQLHLERLLLKYKNRKNELENQQKQELNYLDNENLLKKSNFF
jgi:hypothetical protein